jgi:hypothetical protein
MKEVLDVIVIVGFVYILFIYLRGMNETQIQKHLEMLEKQKEKQKEKAEENKKND